MVPYIIGKAYDKKNFRRNMKKKLLDVDCQKKYCFLSEVKKSLQATKTLGPPPPPQISNGASLRGQNIKFVIITFLLLTSHFMFWTYQGLTKVSVGESCLAQQTRCVNPMLD